DEAQAQHVEERKQFLDFLPADKLAQVLAQDEEFDRLRGDLQTAQPPLEDKLLQARLKTLAQQQEQEFLQLLSPEEAAEYKLRKSPFAAQRFELTGFEASDEELRNLVRIQDEAAAAGAAKSPAPDAAHAKQEQLAAVLGERRLAEFDMML